MAFSCTKLLLSFSLLLAIDCSAQEYDIILKGGTVIDPKNQIHEPLDVAIAQGIVKKIASDIPDTHGKLVIDANGLLVVPGLIDPHVHAFVGEKEQTFAGGFSSVSPDDFTFRAGITTVVDAGTSGWRSFPKFKEEVIDRSETRVLAFLNISGSGMVGAPEEEILEDMDIDMTSKTIRAYPGTIVGIKVGHYRGEQWEPFDRALEAGRQAGVPMMVECHLPHLPLELILKKMRPGDILTHTYGQVDDRTSLVDENGKVRTYILNARNKGVYFDVGHGGGSYHFSQALPALAQGFYPDSFGSDLHRFSMNAAMKDMLNIMSKFLNTGMPLTEIIHRATWNAATIINRKDLGHLSPGAVADIALLRIREGNFGFADAGGFKIPGNKRLEAELTLRNGKVVWDLNGLAAKSVEKLNYEE